VDKSINLCKHTSGWFFRHEAARTGLCWLLALSAR
jgi:hypothetical protein